MTDLNNLMKQAQQMQEKMQLMKTDMESMTVTGEAGAGLVTVTMTGRHDVTRVTIDPDLLKEDIHLLEDLLAAAVNNAVRKVEKTSQEKMKKMTGGMSMPSGFNMGF